MSTARQPSDAAVEAADAAHDIVNQLGDLWHVPVDVRQASNDLADEFVARLINSLTIGSAAVASEQLVSDTIRDSLAFEDNLPRGHLLVQIANRAAHLLFQREVITLQAAYRVDAPRALLDREAVHQAIADNVWPTVDGVEIIEAVPAVMELARPMPTREQIAQVLHDQNQVHAWGTNRCDDACGIAYYQRADAVLALLNGAES